MQAAENGSADEAPKLQPPLPPPVPPVEAEPFVPRGVSSQELMPAATGGRRRRRGGRGRFARPTPESGGESQLISPSNPIPDRGFED